MIATLALAALAVNGPGVQPLPPALPAAVVSEDTGDEVTFKTKDDLLLRGTYWAPKSSRGRSPAALLLHEAGKTQKELADLAVYLNKKGFAVLTFDVRGHGASVCDKANWSEADEKAREVLWAQAVRDVSAAASFLLGRPEVHSTNLSLVGIGSGCTLALRHAHEDENARAVVLVSPEPRCFGTDVAGGIADLGGLPTLLVSSSKAKTVAQRLQAYGHEANGGLEYVDVSLVRSAPEEVVGDKKLGSSTANWLRGIVMPKR